MIVFGLFHMLFSALFALLVGLLYGGLSAPAALACLLGAIPAALFTGRQFAPLAFTLPLRQLRVLEWLLFLFVLYVGLRHFVWLFYYADNTFRTLGVNNLGDLPLHINYIRMFAAGASFPPVNPEFASEALYYPYAVDLYNGLWEALGVPLEAHLFLVGLFLLLASIAALRHWAGWLGIAGFFLNGGWAGWEILASGQWQDYQAPLAWKNFFLSLFVTQRGMMFAIPAGLLILTVLTRAMRDSAPTPRAVLLLTGLLWGGLAFFHLHSFMAVSLMLAGIAIIHRQWRPLLEMAWTAVPLGSLFVLYSTQFLQKAGVIWLQWGWLAGEQNVAAFWWQNLGPWLLLLAAVLVFLLLRRQWRLLALYGFYVALFAVFSVVMLAPWDWDNIKVLIWPWIGLLGVAWQCLPGPEEEAQWRLPVRVAAGTASALVLGILALSGTVSVVSSLSPQEDAVTVYQARELWDMEGALKNVPSDAVFIAAPSYNHPLTYWGRVRVLGYEGHTWSHGIDSSAVSALQARLYAGDPEWQQIATELGATHIVFGPHERQQYGETAPLWRRQLSNLSPVAEVELYALE
jgi:hypothetical protein